MSDELPQDYPHESAVYLYGELVELLGANVVTRETHSQSSPGTRTTMQTHEVYYSWFTSNRQNDHGVRSADLGEFRADGGLSTLNDVLLSLPKNRVQGRERLQ